MQTKIARREHHKQRGCQHHSAHNQKQIVKRHDFRLTGDSFAKYRESRTFYTHDVNGQTARDHQTFNVIEIPGKGIAAGDQRRLNDVDMGINARDEKGA